MFYMCFFKLFSDLKIIFQKMQFLALWVPYFEKPPKILIFWRNIFQGVWHIFCIFSFLSSFQIWKYFVKNSTFWPSGAPFLKNPKNFEFFWETYSRGCGTCFICVFSSSFQIWKYFFKKCTFWPSGAPFLKNPKKFEFFWETYSRGCGTCFICVFSSSFQIWKYFFFKCTFWPSGAPFLKNPKNFELFWETYSRGCGTCFICVFQALSRYENIVSKNALFGPLGPNFWNPQKILNFLRNIFQGAWQMFYMRFFKLFLKKKFLVSGAPFLKKKLNFLFFGNKYSRRCDTCLIWVFSTSFQIWKYFF